MENFHLEFMLKRQTLRPEKERPRPPPMVQPKPLWKVVFDEYQARKRQNQK